MLRYQDIARYYVQRGQDDASSTVAYLTALAGMNAIVKPARLVPAHSTQDRVTIKF